LIADHPINSTIAMEISPHYTALLLSLISGLSTGLGGLVVIFFGEPRKAVVGFMLRFASGYRFIANEP